MMALLNHWRRLFRAALLQASGVALLGIGLMIPVRAFVVYSSHGDPVMVAAQLAGLAAAFIVWALVVHGVWHSNIKQEVFTWSHL